MTIQEYWEIVARNKAATDWQEKPEEFLKGETNSYSKTIDIYMREAYDSERMLMINELRRKGNSDGKDTL